MKNSALAWAAAFFPIVGLVLGIVLSGANYFLTSCGFSGNSANIILVVFLVILTGGLHLDGLSDTSDALFSGKTKEEMLAIMRDPHIGAMGVLALISVLLLKISFLASIRPQTRGVALILMCVLSRWSMVLTIFSFPYARAEGKAKVFIDGINKKIFLAATLITLVIIFVISRSAGILLFGITAVFSYATGFFITKKVGGVTGDAIGAINETAEVVILFGIAILERIIL